MANKNENQQDEVNANNLGSKSKGESNIKGTNETENHGK